MDCTGRRARRASLSLAGPCPTLVVVLLLVAWAAGGARAGDWLRSVRDLEQRSSDLFEQYAGCVVGIVVPSASSMQDSTTAQSVNTGSVMRMQQGALRPRRGTGFVVDGRGYVATSQRLFDGLATDGVTSPLFVDLLLDNGDRVLGRLWGLDQLTRVAVVRAEEPFEQTVIFAATTPEVGALVMTLTRPYELPTSLYFGAVNGIDRRVRPGPVQRLIQTNLPLYPGAPGSPVFSANGEVVGMLQDTLNEPTISFALPTPRLERIVRHLIEYRIPERGCLGVLVEPVTREACEQFRLAPDCHGALIRRVYFDTPAEEAGLLPMDVIIRVNSCEIVHPDDLVYEMYDYRPGDEVQISYRRGDQCYGVSLVLGNFPPDLDQP